MAFRIVVGLGNPGRGYEHTRHNVGFMVVEQLAERWRVPLGPDWMGIRSGQGTVAGVPVLLVEPWRYMNRSGDALANLPLAWQPQDMITVHDDIDLPVGQLRVRHNGGAAGHRGILSIAERFGLDFDRVRIGVGRPPVQMEPADYVLQALTTDERRQLGDAVARAADAVECLLREGLEPAMNRFNVRQPTEEARG